MDLLVGLTVYDLIEYAIIVLVWARVFAGLRRVDLMKSEIHRLDKMYDLQTSRIEEQARRISNLEAEVKAVRVMYGKNV